MVVTDEVDESMKQICEGIELRYGWISFLEMGADKSHIHFLIQSTQNYSPTKIITTVKSIIAKRIFVEHPEVKKQLFGGEFWSDGYFVAGVGKDRSENTVRSYVRNQGKQDEYIQLMFKICPREVYLQIMKINCLRWRIRAEGMVCPGTVS